MKVHRDEDPNVQDSKDIIVLDSNVKPGLPRDLVWLICSMFVIVILLIPVLIPVIDYICTWINLKSRLVLFVFGAFYPILWTIVRLIRSYKS